MRTIEVWRPNPIRIDRCELVDKHPRGEGYYAKVKPPCGAVFIAAKYMGRWGEQDGWFPALPPSVRADVENAGGSQ